MNPHPSAMNARQEPTTDPDDDAYADTVVAADPYVMMRPTPAAPATEPLFRTRKKEGIPPLTLGLLAALGVVLVIALLQWAWLGLTRLSSPEEPPVAAAAPATAPAKPAAPTTAVAPEAEANVAAAAPAAGASTASASPGTAADGSTPAAGQATPAEGEATPVRRCVNALGEVSYSDEACPKGARESAVDTTDPVHVDDPGDMITLFQCKGAGVFWSRINCEHRGGFMIGSQNVPARLSLAEQVAFAQNRQATLKPPRRQAAARTATVAQSPAEPAPPTAASVKAEHCRRLEDKVKALDAYARQPLPPGEQDSLRRDRRALRDEQFRLRC